MANNEKNKLATGQKEQLFNLLKARFEKNMSRHQGLEWSQVRLKLEGNEAKLWSLSEMENTGGEPDVVAPGAQKGEIVFYDCAAESPHGRRSLCYDNQALLERKENKPAGSAMGMAKDMGVEMLTEEQYRMLQQFGPFDTKTSSWVFTPANIRKLGGALFCDYRYGHVFMYHNGAQSYYAARGFRAFLSI